MKGFNMYSFSGNYKEALGSLNKIIGKLSIIAEITEKERGLILRGMGDEVHDLGEASAKLAQMFGVFDPSKVKYNSIVKDGSVDNQVTIEISEVPTLQSVSFLDFGEKSLITLYPYLGVQDKSKVVKHLKEVFKDEFYAHLGNWHSFRKHFADESLKQIRKMVKEDLMDLYATWYEEKFKDTDEQKDLSDQEKNKRDDELIEKVTKTVPKFDAYIEAIFTYFKNQMYRAYRDSLPSLEGDDVLKELEDAMLQSFMKLPASASLITADKETSEIDKLKKDIYNDFKDIGFITDMAEIKKTVDQYVFKNIENAVEEQTKGDLAKEAKKAVTPLISGYKKIIKALKRSVKGKENRDLKIQNMGDNWSTGVFVYSDDIYDLDNIPVKTRFGDDSIFLSFNLPFKAKEVKEVVKRIKPDASPEDLNEATKNIINEKFLEKNEKLLKQDFKEGLKTYETERPK